MKPVLVLVLVLVAVSVLAAAPTCPPSTPQPGPGSPDPFRPPVAQATELNAAAKTLYRAGKWEEARAKYRAALAADPDFLAPQLNIACSFVRQERFREATKEVVALLDRAYVPWAREALEAADLGALKVRPEIAEVRRAMAASAARWGGDLGDDLLFVARQRPPLRVPEGSGVFILNPHQEVWAYSPRTARYRQLTAEDGHVLAMARSPDGARVVLVTADKLVRGAARNQALRGVAVRELVLATMTLGAPAFVEGDVRRVDIGFIGGGFALRVVGTTGEGTYRLKADGMLAPLSNGGRLDRSLAILTGEGGQSKRTQRFGGSACPLIAREEPGEGGVPVIVVAASRGKPLTLKGGAGAGLSGLPIP